jgi:ATP-dependent helicase/nuclease subunit A
MQIMTVHAAKGLEFPVVVIPELDTKFNLSTRSTVFYHEKWGLIHKVKDPDGDWLHTEMTTAFTEEERQAERSELKRLFYVGMTRARDYLLLSATEKEVKAQTIDEGQSWWDWLTLVLPDLTTAEAGELTIDDQRLKLTRAVKAVLPSVEPKGVQLEDEESAATLDLLPATGKMTTKRLSLTPLLTFQECPRRFFWQHRLGSDPATVPQVTEGIAKETDSPNFGLMLGEVFHRLISGPTGGKEAIEPAHAGWFQGLTPSEQEDALAQLREMQENYLASPFVPGAGVQMENEFPFVLSLKGVIIKGIIDRVLFYPDGRMVVVDFKTNRHLPPPGKIRDRYYFQVYLYALALREIYQRLPTEAWIYFVRPNRQLPCPLTAQNLDATEKQIIKTVEYITTHDLPGDYPPGENCEFCPFTLWCQGVVSSAQ